MTINNPIYVYTAEVEFWNGATTETRYYCGGDVEFITQSGDTPANITFEPCLIQPLLVQRFAFDGNKTMGRSQVGYGQLILDNTDGGLDTILTYGVDGRSLVIRRGVQGAAYPSGFTEMFKGTMQQLISDPSDQSKIVVSVRDQQSLLNVPLQTTLYAGNNALPAGLEGTASDLKGKPKPVCYGKVLNVSAPCVNTSKLIYQVNDGAVSSVDAVYDRGIALSAGGVWNHVATPFDAGGNQVITSLWYGGGKYILIGESSLGVFSAYYSTDRVTWTAITFPGPLGSGVGGGYGGGLHVIYNFDGAIYTSSDGITWTSRTNPFGASASLHAVAYLKSTWFLGGGGGIATSPDGATWTVRATSPFYVYGFAYSGSVIVAVGADVGLTQGVFVSSFDGVTWTTRTTTFPTGLYNFVVYSATAQIFLAAGSDQSSAGGAHSTATSVDGITWIRRASPSALGELLAGCVLGGVFYAKDNTSGLGTSYDGITWYTQPAVFPVTSGGGGSFVSTDGTMLLAAMINGGLYAAPSQTYASLADLQDDTKAPQPGSFVAYPAGGYFRLGSAPAGTITADVTQGANAAARTTAQCFVQVLQRAGMSTGGWSATDITNLDAANSDVIGFWAGPNDTPKCGDVADQIAGSPLARWGADATGVIRIAQLTAPSGSPDLTLVKEDMVQPLVQLRSEDNALGLPCYSSVLQHSRNYTVQTTDLATGVGDATRARLALEWLSSTSTDSSVQTAHPLAPQIIEQSLLTSASDAATEVARRQTLRGTARRWFQCVIEMSDANMAAVELGKVVSLTHPRFGLSGGALFRIMGILPDSNTNRLTLTLWG